MTPTLLYGAENWILDDVSLNLLEGFQAEIGRRILRLSRFHSRYSVLLALSWHSMKARVLIIKLGYLCHLISPEVDNIASRTRTLTSQDVYSIGIVQQCLSFDSKVGTQSVATLLNNTDHLKAMLKETKKEILLKDKARTHQEAAQHQLVRLTVDINWLRIWEAVRDRGRYWSRIFQSFFKILTSPLFGDRLCRICSTVIPAESSYFEHLVNSHCQKHTNLSPSSLLLKLNSDSDLTTETFHLIKVVISCHYNAII